MYGIPNSFYDKFSSIDESKSGKKPKKIKNIKDLAELHDDEEPIFSMTPESFFSDIESEFSKVHRKIIDLEDLSQMSSYEKALSATFLIFQWRRTTSQRDFIKNVILNFTKEQIGKTDSAEDIRFLVLLNYIDFFPRYFHMLTMFNIGIALEVFLRMGWTLYINKTNLSYWTSDNPVVIDNITNFDLYKARQIREGCKIYFPLSPKISLLVYDSSYHEYPSRILDTDLQSIIEKNKFQIDNSARQIFSHDDISLVNEFINIVPFRS